MNEDVGAAKLIFSTLGLGIMLLLFHSALRAEQMAWVCSSDAPVKVEHKDGRRILGKSDWSAKQIRRRLKRIKRSGGNGAAHKERRILTRLLRKLAACSDLKSTPAPSPAPTPASCSTALHLPVCGDGICSGAETFADCENDCRGSCGDGSCNLITEDHFSCVQDCTGSYFVVDLSSPACSDSGPGTLAQPFCTIRSSATKLGPGVTVYLRNGKQSFGGFVRFDKAGLPGRLITFRNFPGESPVIDAGEALPLAGSWQEVAATAGGRYKFYTADTSLGAFDSAAQGGEGNYPHSLLQEGRAPLSRLLSEADIYNVLAVDQISEFEAYFIDCGSGRVLLRLFAESPPPDSVPVVSATNNRWVLAASFIQIIGISIRHAAEGIRLEPPPVPDPGGPAYLQTVQQVGIFGNHFEGIARMGIADHIAHPDFENGLRIENNRFEKLGSAVIYRDDAYPAPLCLPLNPAPAWGYRANLWEHALYGSARGTHFAFNQVNMDGPGDAVGVNIGGAYLANKITGRGVGLYGSASSQVLIANNIVDTEGAALSILGLDDGVSILNNTFLSGGTNPSQASVIKIGRYDGNDPASYSHNPVIDFRNNLVMDDDPSSNSYCLSFFNVRYFNRSRIDSNNYFGCRGFGSFHQGPPKWPGFFPSSVFSAASLEESLEQWRSFLLSAPDQSNSDHSNEDTSLISPPHETFESYQDGDLRPALGGSALDNGSSANSPSSDYSGGVRPVDIYSQGRDSTGEAHDRGAIERPCL